MSLIFAWTAFLGFPSTETLIFPMSPFQVCDLSSFFPCWFFDLIDYFHKVFLDCTDICSHRSHCTWVLIVRHPLAPGVWSERWCLFSTRFLEIHGDEPFCRKFVSTSLDIVVQGRHVFKFNQAWIPAELLSTGSPMTSMLYTEGRKWGCPCWSVPLKYDGSISCQSL